MKYTEEETENAVEFLKNKAIYGSKLAGLVTYSELFKEAGLPLPEDIYGEGDSGFANRFMEGVLKQCRSDGLPPLDSLVVLKQGDGPSSGYYEAWAKLEPGSTKDPDRFWSNQVAECMEWGKAEKQKRRLRR